MQMAARDVGVTEACGVLREQERTCALEPQGCQEKGSEADDSSKPGSGLVIVHFPARCESHLLYTVGSDKKIVSGGDKWCH